MWNDLLAAIALILIIEGIIPFLSPGGMRRTLDRLSKLSDGALRFMGLTLMVIGCLLLYIVR